MQMHTVTTLLGLTCLLGVQALAPRWSSKKETTSVPENAVLGTVVPVRATISNSPTSIEILPDPSRTVALSEFTIGLRGDHKQIVEITVSGIIDRETTPEYILELRASNKDGDTRSDDDFELTIIVTDMNDNTPYFLHHKCLELKTVPEPLTAVDAYTATDPDGTFGLGRTTYNISGASSNYDIDAETGIVSVKSGAVIHDDKKTSLKIIAVDDSATNQRTGTGYINVCIGVGCCGNSPGLHSPIRTFVFALQIFIIFL